MDKKCKTFLVSLLTALIFFQITPAIANPPIQPAGDALIRQVLEATQAELGWNTTVEYKTSMDGNPFWSTSTGETWMALSHIAITDFSSKSTASEIFNKGCTALQQVYGQGTRFTYHNYPACSVSAVSEHKIIELQVGQYIIEIYGRPASAALNILDVFFKHAVFYGFMRSDEPEIIATPDIEPTLEPAGYVHLTARADGYSPVAQVIDNSLNYNTLNITGRVTDQMTGGAITGALIQITSGAIPAHSYTGVDGVYSLIAVVTGGQDSAQVNDFDFALETAADLTISVISENGDLPADGISTSRVIIQVVDGSRNPIAGREIDLSLSGKNGPGTIHPVQGISNENGLLEATYTAFKLEPGTPVSATRHEVTITVQDRSTGLTGLDTIFVSQYSLAITHEEFLPACSSCDLPANFSLQLSDYWLNPVANAPLSVRVQGDQGGFIALPESPNTLTQEIKLTTDSSGRAYFTFKWQGILTAAEAVYQIVILDELTHTQEIRQIRVQGLDIAIARVEEAGFTGVTGHQAFLKIYFKERAHPSLSLDRFNILNPNKLGLRVSISQFHSDGTQISQTFESTGHWMTDERGSYIQMYATPSMPYIIPVNDGTTWYEVRVDPVIDQDVYLPDMFRGNNSTIIALTTGSPESWLHIWLTDGILTPTSYVGVTVKCVARFLPGLGDALTVIDTLNQVYNSDLLGLSQSTTQVLTEALQKRAEQMSPGLLTKLKASTLNNLVSCIQDAYGVHKQSNTGRLPGQGACSLNASLIALQNPEEPMQEPLAFPQLLLDQFVHGMLLDDPNQKAVILFGVDAADLQILDNQQRNLGLPDTLSHENGTVVFIFHSSESYTLQIETRSPLEAALYAAGTGGERETLRFNVDLEIPSQSNLNITSGSDPVLTIDLNNDGLPEQVLSPERTQHDILKPIITETSPVQGQTMQTRNFNLTAAYLDEPGGSGVDPTSVRLWLNDVDETDRAIITPQNISLPLSDLNPGIHRVRLEVRDMFGNAAISEWSFMVQQGFIEAETLPLIGMVVCGGLMLITSIVTIILLIVDIKKKRKQIFAVQAANGKLDSVSGSRIEPTGENWHSATQAEPVMNKTNLPKLTHKTQRAGLKAWLVTLMVGGGMFLLITIGVSLVAFQFLPGYQISPQADVTLQDVLLRFGGGSLISLIGLFALRGGIFLIFTNRNIVEDEWGHRRQQQGCAAVISGIFTTLFGFLFLSVGLLLAALSVYQQVLPLLGF